MAATPAGLEAMKALAKESRGEASNAMCTLSLIHISIEEGFVHATAGLQEEDPECDLDYTKGEGVSMNVNCALSNSLGFGGHNATLLVKKFEG